MAKVKADGVSIPVVDIDDNGTFKYVLLKVNKPVLDNTTKENVTYLVRGHSWASFHGMFDSLNHLNLGTLGPSCDDHIAWSILPIFCL